MRGQIVGVEFPGVHRGGAGGFDGGDLVTKLVGLPCSQHHRGLGSQAPGEFDADLAAAAENYYRSSARVVHSCDYGLR